MTDAAPSLERLKVRIFADGADLPGLLEMAARPYVSGFTTNPTLMRKAGVADYGAFAARSWRPSATGRSPSRSSPTSPSRWSARRARSPRGAPTCS